MSLLVTGSIGIDTVKTPFGVSENCIGGSAVYFSMSASILAPVRFVGAIGDDCPFDLKQAFVGKDVDFTGLEVRSQSKTFRWKGAYEDSMNTAITENVELNILAEQPPKVPKEFADSDYVFLANTMPSLQSELLSQIDNPKFVAADTMNCWISNQTSDLEDLMKKIDALIINDAEAAQLADEYNLIKAAKKILTMGPSVVIIKKGESGSLMCNNKNQMLMLPAFPADEVKDPTGAGDSFAGAFMGYIAANDSLDFNTLKKAVAYGTAAASFTISDFTLDGINKTTKQDLDERIAILKTITDF